MSIDRQKVLDSAQKFAAKGQFDRAIAEYLRVLKEDPHDVRVLLKVGDLQVRRGAREEAIATYSKVAKGYEEQGFALKAIAVYKQILSIDTNLSELYGKLAELYAGLGLLPDALSNLEALASRYARAGNDDKLVEVARRMVEIDSSNVGTRIKLAELLSKLGRNAEAAVEFELGGKALLQSDRLDDWARVMERLLYHRPDDAKAAQALASHYLERSDAKRALPKLQVAFKAHPRDVDVLELLGRAFFELGQQSKTVSVLKEIARILLEKNELDRRVRVCERILEIVPNDADAKAALELTLKAIEATRAPAPAADIEIDDDDSQVVVVDEDVEIEASVVDVEPSPSTRERAALDAGPHGRQASSSATTKRGPSAQRAALTRRPSSTRMPAVRPPPALVSTEAGRQLAERLVEEEEMHPDVAKITGEVDIFLKYNLRTKAIAHLSRALEIDPRSLPVHARLREVLASNGDAISAARHAAYVAAVLAAQDLDAATWAVLRAIELDPSNADALDLYARIAEVVAAPGDASQDPNDDIVVDDEIVETHELAADIEAGLDEVEFFVSQGLYIESLETLKNLLRVHPEHPLVLDRYDEVMALSQAQGEDDESFALAEKLAEEVQVQGVVDAHFAGADQMIDVETVFAQFKKGVERVVSADDADTHYDLGIAYKEMGLIDDAMSEFMVSAQAPRKQCLAQNMVGQCLMEKGDPASAIPWFEQALSAPLRSDREEMAIFYELGNAWELVNQPVTALQYFKMAQRREPSFRDVNARISRLDSSASVRGSVPEMDDVDRAFEELLKG
ncbi:MAG: tetratricopeptide repeat protein [Deltaproteobacteria bacterium]|nr:tetratricopeptide repeat protein [Deltaproteobacteria bacterium]